MSGIEEARKKIQEADRMAAALFEKRMNAVREVAEYKKKNGLPVYDAGQEAKVFERCAGYIKDEELSGYYMRLLNETVKFSKEYQEKIIAESCRKGGGVSDT